jgi:predicted PurR-regulated permease PerM
MAGSDREFTRRMVWTVLTVTAVAIIVDALWAVRAALMLIYVSAIIAMGFSPMVRVADRPNPTGAQKPNPAGAQKRVRVRRTLAILAIYLGMIAVCVLVGLTIIPPLVDQAGQLWTRLPQAFSDLQRFLIRRHIMTTTSRVTLQQAVENAPAGSGGNAVGTVLGAIWSVVGGVFGLVTILILSFYLLVEAEGLFEYVTRFVPEPTRKRFVTVARESVDKVSAWLRAQFILAGVMAAFAGVGLGLMGVPYFYVVALMAAVGETIPIVGPIVAGAVAVAIASTVSAKLALSVGVYFLVLHQLEANVLVPKIMERRVGVSPVTVIVALLIGVELWGLLGAILAIPTAAILSVIVQELTADAAP